MIRFERNVRCGSRYPKPVRGAQPAPLNRVWFDRPYANPVEIIAVARPMAESVLEEVLPRRWRHVQAVAAKAEGPMMAEFLENRSVLVAAAWLHDVGYGKGIAMTGLHALDGARWLRAQGLDERVAALVAYHSCAEIEAEERGLADALRAEFVDEASPVRDALWYCDMTTGPDGQDMTVGERLAEIRARYGPDDPVTRFWARAEPMLLEAVRRTEERLSAGGAQPM